MKNFLLKQKNANLQQQSNEHDNLDLSDLFEENENLYQEFKKVEEEANRLKADYHNFELKSKMRENELKNHVKNLLDVLKNKDLGTLKDKFMNLQNQIQENINNIELNAKEQITSSKSEINSRSQLRLMDSESCFNQLMNSKVREQQGMITTFREFTGEMETIKTNYSKVRNKVDSIFKQNLTYKSVIEELQFKNAKAKIELLNYKKFNNIAKMRIISKLKSKNNPKILQPQNKQEQEYQSDAGNSMEVYPKIKKQGDDKNSIIVSDILQNKTFLRKYPKSSGIISSLANILENSKMKLSKLKNEIKSKQLNSELVNLVNNTISDLKLKELGGTANIFKVRKIGLNSKKPTNEVLISKEERATLIQNLISNPDLYNLIDNPSFPNILINQRKINSYDFKN